jgi:ribosomal protein L31E
MTTRLTNIALPNVEVASKELTAGVHSYKLSDPLLPVAHKLAINCLDRWKIVAFSAANPDTNAEGVVERTLKNIVIFEGGEKLGTVKMDRRWKRSSGHENVYSIHSHRIQSRKGNYKETSKVKEAIKIVMTHFTKKMPKELIKEGHISVTNSLNSQKYSAGRELDHRFGQIESDARAFVLDRLDEFNTVYPNHAKTVEAIVEAYANHDIVKSVSGLANANTCVTVLLLHGEMIVEEGDVITRYANGGVDAPEHIRRKIGLLKLVQDSQIVRDVGIRVNAHTFGITPEVKQ